MDLPHIVDVKRSESNLKKLIFFFNPLTSEGG